MVANDKQIHDVIERSGLLGHGSGANRSLPMAGLVDQLVKHLNQDRMKSLLS